MKVKFGAILIALIVLIPIFSIFFEIALGDYSLLEHFFKYLFMRYIQGTFAVAAGVLALSLVIAVVSAWLVANYRFALSNFFEYALILPFAIPAYIFSFCYVGIMDYGGYFHQIFGFRLEFMNIYGAIFVLSLSLYPYIYMFAKTSFKTQSAAIYDVCKIYKLSGTAVFFRVAIFLSRPAIVGGAMLALMETLSDYGTAAYYGVETFSAGIFKLWFDMGDSYSASVLAGLLMMFVFILMIFEHVNKNSKKYSFSTHDTSKFTQKKELGKFGSAAAFLWCASVFCLAFAFPFTWLLYWSIHELDSFKFEFVQMALNSLLMAAGAAILITAVSFFLVFATRLIKNKVLNAFLLKSVSLGYALPGASIGLCVMIVFGYIDRNFGTHLLSSSFVVLIFGYVVRFLATSIYTVESGYAKIPANIDDAALLLNGSRLNLFFKVHFPLLRHFFFLSLIVVFIDIIKELPLSLILRPLGFETLSIRAFFYAADERLYAAALPSFLIVLMSLVAVLWLEIISRKNKKDKNMDEILKIVNLNKKFGNLEVLKDVNFNLNEGEILSILGDSGCGKSTLLRIIAGLETPSSGQIAVKDGCGTAMMFQSYALFPHLSVCKNVEFALWRLPSAERTARSAQLLEKFKISELKDKTPDQISGGQAQRTAFARAVANREKLLLLDEPFANLDRNLKSALRGELKQMIKANGISAVMVTHDKEDAFLLSDKTALIKEGKVLAFGAPRELYFSPASYEIACFLGDMNLIDEREAQNLPAEFRSWLKGRNFMFRPELIISGEKYEADVVEAKFLGVFYELNLDFCGVKFKAVVSSDLQICDKFKFDLA